MAVRSEVKQSVRNNPVDSKLQKERRVLQVPEQIFPCCPWDSPAACVEDPTAKDPQCGWVDETMAEQVEVP